MARPTLQDLLDRLPDNDTGAIDAVDLREVVTALWLKSGAAGEVAGDGTLVAGPPGWTAERVEVGLYKVTHGLGIDADAYSVAITEMQLTTQVPVIAAITETTSTSFTFGLATADGTPTNRYSAFVMAVN